jgi:coiled-coil domain-containing protein 55
MQSLLLSLTGLTAHEGRRRIMSKYGLNLRPQQKKQPTRPPLHKPVGFGDDDDNNVEREISRHATKNKSLKDIEEQQRKALEQDPSVFDYDGVYDDMKQKAIQPRAQDRQERKPRYIQHLMKKAEERNREHEIVFERKLAKERSEEDHLYADKDKFVTKAYKKKLAEQAKWMEEDRLRQLREEKDDVTKKTDLSEFYFNLEKNVAFGAEDAKLRKEKQAELRKLEKQAEASEPEKEVELRKPEKLEEGEFAGAPVPLESPRLREEHEREDTTMSETVEPSDEKPASNTAAQEKLAAELPPADQPKANHHKRGEDAVAAAKERFLARKRAKEQQKYYEN